MDEQKDALSPRETALRMLRHMHDDVSYEDIVGQLRILSQIDLVVGDLGTAGPLERSAAETGDGRGEAEDAEAPLQGIAGPTPAENSSLVLRTHSVFSWRSLADRDEDGSEPFKKRSSWI